MARKEMQLLLLNVWGQCFLHRYRLREPGTRTARCFSLAILAGLTSAAERGILFSRQGGVLTLCLNVPDLEQRNICLKLNPGYL